jgi:phage/plasmid-like protein (TIGR03299 family)
VWSAGKYEPVQNEASCDLLDALVDESGGAHFSTAGALRGGRETFVTMKLPNAMVFDGRDGSKDRTEFYLAALNSHGSSAFRCLVTPIRIVCANTQSAAVGSAKASWGISHTGGARAAIQEARNALKLSWRYIEAFEEEAAKLYAQPMDTEQVRRFADTLLEVESAATATTAKHRKERAAGIVKLWTSSPTIAPIAGTRWAAYNAVTEFCDHVVPVRGARTASDASATRALRSITAAGSAHSLQAKAFAMLQTL